MTWFVPSIKVSRSDFGEVMYYSWLEEFQCREIFSLCWEEEEHAVHCTLSAILLVGVLCLSYYVGSSPCQLFH